MALAQPLQLDMKVFADRREAFMKKMEFHSAAIFPAAPEYMRNRDVEYEYRQESNFYYLSGFQEPEAILLLAPSQPKYRYILFVQKRDPRSEAYDGPRSGIEGAMITLKADTAIYAEEFERSVYRFVPQDAQIYYAFGINPLIDEKIKQLFVQRRSSGNWPMTDPAPLIAEMRLIKDEGDFRMGLSKAIDISTEAHIEAIKSLHPGMYEYEVQAVFEYIYRKNGSPRDAYPCIIASGHNSSILHYSKNTRMMNDGDIVLMDCGAEYGYYSADITRTVPVNGVFTKEQREIYQLVLDAQNAAMKAVRPGLIKATLDSIISDRLAAGLLRMHVIKDAKDVRIFTAHGYSHWLGLDVHDVGSYTVNGKSRQLEPGMVFTLEPGIYIRPGIYDALRNRGYSEEELAKIRPTLDRYMDVGVRIEDDVLVTEDGYRHLSAAAPREIDAIEALMKQRGISE